MIRLRRLRDYVIRLRPSVTGFSRFFQDDLHLRLKNHLFTGSQDRSGSQSRARIARRNFRSVQANQRIRARGIHVHNHRDLDNLLVRHTVNFIHRIQNKLNNRVCFLCRVNENGHRQRRMDLPALGFKHRWPHTVTDTQGRLCHIRFIIGQNRDKQSTGNLRVADRKRNTHSTRDTHVRDNLKPHRIQAFCQVNQQTIRFSFENRPASVPHT